MGTKKKYMTVKEYATRFSLNQKTVYNKIERGEIKAKKVLNTTLVEL